MSGPEKRKHDRLRSFFLVRYRRLDQGPHAEEKITNVRNISEGGALVTTYETLPVSSTIHIRINLPGRETPVESYAKIMRCVKASETEEVYHVGICFLDLRDEDRLEISKHVELAINDRLGKKLIKKHHWWQIWRRRKIRILSEASGNFFLTDDTTHEKPSP